MEQVDINSEYEHIFGRSNYPTLYDSQDEEYIQLRQQIVEIPLLSYLSSKLPFEDIYNTPHTKDLYNELNLYDTDNLSCYNIVDSIRNHVVNLLTGILSSLSNKSPNNLSLEIKIQVNKHFFWISSIGRCKAYGYLDKESKNFYIGAGSLISVKDESDYIATSSYRNRHKLLEKHGILMDNYIKLKRDVKCRSAVAAARYVMGATVSLDLWKDVQGRTIYDIYPEIFLK